MCVILSWIESIPKKMVECGWTNDELFSDPFSLRFN